MILSYSECVDNWFFYLAVYMFPLLLAQKSIRWCMPCSQNPKPLFSKAFTEKYMKGETQAAEDAGRYQWDCILKRD